MGVSVERDPNDLQEVNNYIDALDYGIERLKTFPMSLRLIREVHEKLMQGVRGQHLTPGEFCTTQNWIGHPGSTLSTAKYIPPPPDHLVDCLGAFEKFLHDETFPPLIHIALCHYQFESIHPFLDGNGRIGRLLIILLLLQKNLLPAPLFYLSAFFEATREEYYTQLYNVSAKGSWNDWFIYFLNGINLQGLDVLSRAERINSLLTEWQIKVGVTSKGIVHEIVRYLAGNPYFTIRHISKELDVAFSTVQRAIKSLEDLNIIKEVSHRKRDKVYCSIDILNILEEQTRMSI